MAIKDMPHSVEEMPPTFTVSEVVVPEIKNWKVGGKYQITLDVQQIASEKIMYGKDKGKLEARFEILNNKSGDSLVKKELKKRVY